MADEYVPVEFFRDNDYDRSSYPVRDYPAGKRPFDFSVNPAELEFTLGTVNTPSDSQTVLLSNTGYQEIQISQVLVVGDFELVGVAPTKLAVGATTPVQVRYKRSFSTGSNGALIVEAAVNGLTKFIELNVETGDEE